MAQITKKAAAEITKLVVRLNAADRQFDLRMKSGELENAKYWMDESDKILRSLSYQFGIRLPGIEAAERRAASE